MLSEAEMARLREAAEDGEARAEAGGIEELQQRLADGQLLSEAEMERLREAAEDGAAAGAGLEASIEELQQRLAAGQLLSEAEMARLREAAGDGEATGGAGWARRAGPSPHSPRGVPRPRSERGGARSVRLAVAELHPS